MPNLDALAAFALDHDHNLTGPLRHEQVVALANAWFPEIRFHEAERFHPVDLPGLLSIPPVVFGALSEPAKDAFRITVTTAQGITQRFDPPVVHIPSAGARRVLGSGATAGDAMEDTELSRDGIYTYGARLEAAQEFFGADRTVYGAGTPTAGDPRAPRHSPIVVRAEMRMLLETLRHELELDNPLPPGLLQPIDAIWSGFAVEDSFFAHGGYPAQIPRSSKRKILADLVKVAGDLTAEADVLRQSPFGYAFVQRAWDAVKQFAFLEFNLVYAYNDYRSYGDWPFENEHEGDIEGCCVVFERRFLEQYALGNLAARDVVPHTVITSVHEEANDADRLKRLPLERDRARDDLVVYVAPGSHATYLTPGSHDVVDFGDFFDQYLSEVPTWAMILFPIEILSTALIAAIIEHFVDSEDETSDDGVSVGPDAPAPDSLQFEKRLDVTPLSNIQNSGENIYQGASGTTSDRAALAIRAFPGKWGAHDGTIDRSTPWENKTARYFRRFLQYGDIKPTIVIL
jgi:hypothetical protein